MKKAFRKMLAILMALTMIVANFAMLAVYAEDGAAHAEEYKCPGVGEEHDKSNCDWTKGETVDPVCAKPGYTLYYCKGCKAPFMSDIVPGNTDAAHNPGKPVTTEPADCTTPGSIVVTCQNEGCGVVISETVIPAPGHKMVEDGEGCKCANCDEMTLAKHDYRFVEITKYPTKDGRGEAKFRCTNCPKEMLLTEVSKLCDKEAHEWKYVAPQDPTCQQEGCLGYIYCVNCDEAFFKKTADKLDHEWDNGEIVTDATCTKTGVKKYTCTSCKTATYTETIPMKAHVSHVYGVCACGKTHSDYGNDSDLIGKNRPDKYRDPNCMVEGYKVYTCAVCEIVMKELNEILPKTGHSYDLNKDGVIDEGAVATSTEAPNCTDKGSATYTCEFCSERETFEIAAKGHTEKVYAALAPTCTTAGWTEGKYCEVCSNFALDENSNVGATATWLVAPVAKDALGHTYEKDFFKPANCREFSESYKVCIRCNEKDPECEIVYGTELDPDNHILGSLVITPATCTKPGLNKVWCTLCDKNDLPDVETAPKGHVFDKGVVETPATCTTKGKTRYTCTVADCDGCVEQGHTHTNACKSYLAEDIAAKGHNWGDITKTNDATQCVVTPETCKDNGSVAAKCQDCDAVADATTVANKTVYIVLKADAAKHHDGVKNVASVKVLRAPDCVTRGNNRYECSLCGKTYTLQTVYGDCANKNRIDAEDYDDLFCNAADLTGMIIAKCESCGAYYSVVEGASTNDPAQYTRIYTDKETLPAGATVTLKIHNVTKHDGDPYNCMDNGYDAYEKCDNCGYNTKVNVIAQGHKFMDDQNNLNVIDYEEVGCTTWGYKIVECLVCDQLIMVDFVAPVGHTYTPEGATAAITGIFSCKDEDLLKALEGKLLEDDILCDVCDEPIHNIAYLPEVVACDGVYTTAYCTELCGYEYVVLNEAFDTKLHDDPAIFDWDVFEYCALETPVCVKPATATRGNVWEAVCKFCGETMTYTDTEIVDELTFGYDIFGAEVGEDGELEISEKVEFTYDDEVWEEAIITNNGYLAFVITTTSPGVEVNSIALQFKYNALRLEFVSGYIANPDFSDRLSDINGNDYVDEDSDDMYALDATLTIFAISEDGSIGVQGTDEQLAVVFFKVLPMEEDFDEDVYTYVDFLVSKAQVFDENTDDVDFEFADYWYDEYYDADNAWAYVYKLGDVNMDDSVDFKDLTILSQMMEFDYEAEFYNPMADVDGDGEYTIVDYGYLKDVLFVLESYLEFCGH